MKVPALCGSCQKTKPIFSPSKALCRYCYTKAINTASLGRIEKEFHPISPYNRELFGLYLRDLKQGYIKNCDLPVTARWAAHLSSQPVMPFQSWSEVLALSEKLKIRHGRHPTYGCPVMRTARTLVREGKLPARQDDGASQTLIALRRFPVEWRGVMSAFHADVARKQRRATSGLKMIRAVASYFEFLRGSGPGIPALWSLDVEQAQAFMDQLPSGGVSDYAEHWTALKRFYRWGLNRGECAANPFEDVTPKRLLRICKNCRKPQRLTTNDLLCNTCYVDRNYRRKVEATEARFSARTEYHQKIFELYLKYILYCGRRTGEHSTIR